MSTFVHGIIGQFVLCLATVTQKEGGGGVSVIDN